MNYVCRFGPFYSFRSLRLQQKKLAVKILIYLTPQGPYFQRGRRLTSFLYLVLLGVINLVRSFGIVAYGGGLAKLFTFLVRFTSYQRMQRTSLYQLCYRLALLQISHQFISLYSRTKKTLTHVNSDGLSLTVWGRRNCAYNSKLDSMSEDTN